MEHVITVDDRRVRYLDAGSGRPALLLHAFPLSADLWRPQLVSPPSGWRLIAPDLRGFGQSDRSSGRGEGGRVTVDDYAADVLALCDALGIDRFAVAGVSMGGYVAFALVRQAPSRVAGLLLADTRTDADGEEARANRATLGARAFDEGVEAVVEAMLPKLLGATTTAQVPALATIVRRLIDTNTVEAIVDALHALSSRPDSADTLTRVTCPVALVVGEEDTLTPVAVHEAMQALVPGATLDVIRRAGHLSNLERPDEFNDVLRVFLART